MPTKRVIERLFELANEPCGLQKLALMNIGLSKLLAGSISWYYSKPGARVVAWKRLVARYDRDGDLLLIHLLTGPARLLWSVVRGKRAGRRGSPSSSPAGTSPAAVRSVPPPDPVVWCSPRLGSHAALSVMGDAR